MLLGGDAFVAGAGATGGQGVLVEDEDVARFVLAGAVGQGAIEFFGGGVAEVVVAAVGGAEGVAAGEVEVGEVVLPAAQLGEPGAAAQL